MDLITPCYIIDLDRLAKNLSNISRLRRQTGCKVLLALKGFSMPGVIPMILKNLDGLSASGAFEARFAKEFRSFVSTFAPAYPPAAFPQVVENSDIVVFNSEKQFKDLSPAAVREGVSCGIRVNPQYSELPENFGADPCRRYSHLGILREALPSFQNFGPGKIEGIHLHAMCAQGADTLNRTVINLIDRFEPVLKRVTWLNLGGGQLYGADDYDMDLAIASIRTLTERYPISVFVEPCEGVLTQCGFLLTRVLDIIYNEMNIAVLDSSAVCHLSDAVFRGWTRDALGGGEPGQYAYNIRLAGCSCYAGDIFGDYSFPSPLQKGDLVVFQDTATYSAVKACWFNGLPLPRTAVYSKHSGFQMLKEYDYKLFRQAL